jgi:hypothetical protein
MYTSFLEKPGRGTTEHAKIKLVGVFFLTYQAINNFVRYLVEINLLRENYSGKCEAKNSATQNSR